jgi:catechol 2,3-dioxygenase-like lactoylglutathione lyase family enzyme
VPDVHTWYIIQAHKEQTMELGAFSVSLSVQDIEASRDFYAKLGFEVFAGDSTQNWLILFGLLDRPGDCFVAGARLAMTGAPTGKCTH